MGRKLKKTLVLTVALVLFASVTLNVSAASLRDYFDARYYASLYPDLQDAYGDDEEGLYQHYITFGIKEGRSASRVFNVNKYREKYADLDAAFGDDWDAYATHYTVYGIKEGRDGGGDGTLSMDKYGDKYYDVYAAYGANFFIELEKCDILGKTTDRQQLVNAYYTGKNALTASSQSATVRAEVDSNYALAEAELHHTSYYYIAYLNATDDDMKESLARLYNGSYQEYAKYRDNMLLKGTKEDADKWYDTYHAVAGEHGVSKGDVLPQELAVAD